jgi:hypothetical protein
MQKRCTECRKWFCPAWSAKTTQRVCGAACRNKRRRKLARARRRQAIDRYRVEERERQREHRRQRGQRTSAASAPRAVGPRRHEPASRGKYLKVREKVLDFWDELQRASRATLERALPGILARSLAPTGTETGA